MADIFDLLFKIHGTMNNLLRQSGIDKKSQHKTNIVFYNLGDDWQAINRFRGAVND